MPLTFGMKTLTEINASRGEETKEERRTKEKSDTVESDRVELNGAVHDVHLKLNFNFSFVLQHFCTVEPIKLTYARTNPSSWVV